MLIWRNKERISTSLIHVASFDPEYWVFYLFNIHKRHVIVCSCIYTLSIYVDFVNFVLFIGFFVAGIVCKNGVWLWDAVGKFEQIINFWSSICCVN